MFTLKSFQVTPSPDLYSCSGLKTPFIQEAPFLAYKSKDTIKSIYAYTHTYYLIGLCVIDILLPNIPRSPVNYSRPEVSSYLMFTERTKAKGGGEYFADIATKKWQPTFRKERETPARKTLWGHLVPGQESRHISGQPPHILCPHPTTFHPSPTPTLT